MRIAVFALLFLATGLVPAQAENGTIRTAVDGFIRPAYAELNSAATRLDDAMSRLCIAPDPQALAAGRARFHDILARWSSVESLRLGPIMEQNRLERFVYWPDRKGIGLRQIQAALASGDPSVETAATLAGKSVAMQGLGALDFVLFGTGADALADAAGRHRCLYAAAISGNLVNISRDVMTDWNLPQGFAAQWANPGPGNALYRTDAEAMNDLLDIFVQGLEAMRDTRLNAFLGESPSGDKPKQAIFWRAQGTVLSLQAALSGLQELFEASKLGDLARGDSAYIAQSIDFEFANGARALQAVDAMPVADALADSTARGKLDYVRVVTSSLSDLFANRLAAALNLTAGFSSLDGD